MKIVNDYEYVIDYDILAKDVRQFRDENDLRNWELDELLGYSNLVGQLLGKHRRYGTFDKNTGKLRNMQMNTFLDLCNLIDRNPSRYVGSRLRGKRE